MALSITDLRFAYPGRQLLHESASLTVEPGSVVGLTGPSGSGKSTLGALVAGNLLPLGGEIRVDGKELPSRGFRPVQMIHQQPEHAVNPRWRMRRVLNESRPMAPADLEAVGIREDWLDRWPDELSGGELQRFCIARALHPGTRYLVADEITTMFDAITQAEIWHLLLGIVRSRNLGLLVISHEQALLDRVCDEQVPVSRFQPR